MPPPKKKIKYRTKCQVCEKPAQVHYKKHVLKYHLPWFMNPTVACSDCLKSEGDNSALNRNHLYHGHRGIVGEEYLQAWCLLMNGMFYFIMQELGLKSFSDLLAYAGTLEIRFIKFREEELVFLREYDRRAGMEPLKDFEYMTVPPTRIISLSYYMVMAEILLKMSETAQTAFRTLNHYVKRDGSVAPEGHIVFKLAIIDSHFHMDMLSSDILTLTGGLDNPSINPVQLMYGIASYVHVETWHTINRHLRSNPALRFTIGVDPHEVLPHMARPLFSMLESRLSQHPDALGIGEVGLDYTNSCLSDHDKEDCSVSYRQIEEQHQFLRLVFKLFKQDDNKVLILHVRDKGDGSAARDVLSLLEEYGLQDARIHRNCFVGGKEEYETWSKTLPNCYFSLARRSLEEIGTETWALLGENKDRLILETNAPYNEEKEPLNVYKIAEEVASKTGMTLNDLVRICNMNAVKLYNLTWQSNPS